MTLPAGKVAICNIALDYIGGERVANIDSPTTDTEMIMSRQYDTVRQETLREYVPNFAKLRASIPRVSTTPEFDFTDAYQLPNNFIRLLSVGGSSEEYQFETGQYDLSENYLLANNGGESSIDIRYVADIEDVSKWDSGFRSLVSIKLAIAVCVQITDDARKAAYLTGMLEKRMPTVLGVDAQEKPPIVINRSPILARRRGYRSGSADRDTRYLDFS